MKWLAQDHTADETEPLFCLLQSPPKLLSNNSTVLCSQDLLHAITEHCLLPSESPGPCPDDSMKNLKSHLLMLTPQQQLLTLCAVDPFGLVKPMDSLHNILYFVNKK